VLSFTQFTYSLPRQIVNTLLINKKYLSATFTLHYPLSYRVPVRERYGSTLLPATREQHDQNCTQSH
jgi:hypothetical protein